MPPDFGRNTNWLLEQCHRIWLTVGINGSWKRSAIDGEKDFAVFFIALWSYRRKICLNMCYGNSENSDGCSYLLRICFIYRTNVSVSWSWTPVQVVDHEQGAFWFTNKRLQIKILSILKLVSFESLARNDFSEGGTQAERLPAKETSNWEIANCEVLDKKYRITVQEIFGGIITS